MNTQELTGLLEQKFRNDDGVMFLTEVANSTGGGARRFADAVTVDLWPSRGYSIQGYEIKVSKSDLEHELQDVTKWEAVGQFCDKWWLVVGDKTIVDLERLPAIWGVMYPTKTGKLRILKPASKLKPKPFTKGFMASLLRKAADHNDFKMKLNAEYRRGWSEGLEKGSKRSADNCGCERFRKNVETFEKASGIKIEDYGGERLGEDFKAFREGRISLRSMRMSEGHIARSLKTMTEKVESLQDSLKEEKF